ncbi:hypothetical protein CB0940_02028 [Cercospora beticola]|uniref:Uncharacterized protein n=1 Tax=Cercospora beticola TaxID=122368 RepID=A0A2G5I6W3_CERBT|nr:hypothetical protein CB0940_02028 [Cercospora beticola]PIB00576.1 hypothetical protein CB0940_02028 [Cercospora beticola]
MALELPTRVITTSTSTTIELPTYSGSPVWGYAVYPASAGLPAQARRLGATSPGPRTTVAVAPGFALYFPFSAANPTRVTWTTLVSVLNDVYPGVYTPTGVAALRIVESALTPITSLSDSVVSLSTSDTIYIPITINLATRVDMNGGIAVLRAAATPTSPAAGTSTSAGTDTPATSTRVENTPGPDDDEAPSTAILAGGIVGGVLAAILLCGLLGCFLIRRKRSKRSAQASEEGNKNAPGSKSGMTGSQKQKMDNTNPLVIEVADSSAVPISDLWLAPKGNRTRWWHFGREGGR